VKGAETLILEQEVDSDALYLTLYVFL